MVFNLVQLIDFMKAKLLDYKYVARPAARARPVTKQSPAPQKREMLALRLLIVTAVVLLLIFIRWFFTGHHTGYYPLYMLLCISVGYKMIKLLFEWYHYWSINTPPARTLQKAWTVDMLTTAMPGEPFDMIADTLRAMTRVRYPHTSYLCDEGNDPALKQLCDDLGVVHVTRQRKVNAKAGNINNALQQATGEICVVLDPDHAPLPQFLDEVLPYFDDPRTGFVQVAQVYKNAGDTWIAQGAAQQTYSFYGPLMMGMNSYGTAQAIGANCTFRRAALDSIGGHAAGLSEDMHTAMQLHAKGWKSVYLPRVVTRGLVPANTGAYYKQQLKWSRGTFELLLAVYPFLFTRFTARQKLHYFLLPFHFATGIIALIDIVIPVAVLFSGEVPLYFNTGDLWWVLLPFFSITLLIRQYAQRWLLEKHEQGFHLAGGLLLFGTWWIYTTGFMYTLLRINVPYIPTPKEDELSNNWKLNIPNIIACLVCISAVVYGLSHDWNPYNFVSAGFALLTVCMLGTVIIASQQLVLRRLRLKIQGIRLLHKSLRSTGRAKENLLYGTYGVLRKRAPLLAAATVFAALFFPGPTENMEGDRSIHTKSTGGFYTGVYIPELQDNHSFAPIDSFQKATGTHAGIVSLYEAWKPQSPDSFPLPLLQSIAAHGSIPMITWEPWLGAKGMAAIAGGRYDAYIRACALAIRDYQKPVFIRFAHEPDNPAYPWSAAGGNTPEEYKAAWRRVVELFAAAGAGNVSWVWNPWQPATMKDYYPGDAYTDWIGITCLNYGSASWNGQWHSFEALYNPYRKSLLALNKPVMLAEFGSTGYGGDAGQWLSHALQAIHADYTEIQSLVFFHTSRDKNWATAWRPTPESRYIDWTVTHPERLSGPLASFTPPAANPPLTAAPARPAAMPSRPAMLQGAPGAFTLMVNGKPFYVKGIAYNPGQDWRDGHYPLTIPRLEKDFAAIRQTGCNTIRRYQPSVYDRNILRTAAKQDLKVLYGFWFSPKVDYYKDTQQVKKYIHDITEKVAEYKDNPAILAWCTGSQTESGLSNYFTQPYLQQVQKAYLQMIETMAQAIHRTDSLRPVVTAMDDGGQLPALLLSCRRWAPSVDIIGINARHEQQLSALPQVLQAFDSTRPFLITEFGPKEYRDAVNTLAQEDNDIKKAALYTSTWKDVILAHRGSNLGGMAFCWKDRFEGSATWAGITDYQGRRKASYYALQQLWLGRAAAPALPRLFLAGPQYALETGRQYEFTAVYNGGSFKKPEWHLYREDKIGELGTLTASGSDNKIFVSVPEENARYRLYVYIDDGHGNVATASIPIVPYNGIHNKSL